MNNSRGTARDSSNRTMPRITVPTAPIPVQTAYPVPIGIVRTAPASQIMLAASAERP